MICNVSICIFKNFYGVVIDGKDSLYRYDVITFRNEYSLTFLGDILALHIKKRCFKKLNNEYGKIKENRIYKI